MVRTIEVHVPMNSGVDEAELAARVRRAYPGAQVSARRVVHALGAMVNDGRCTLAQAELDEQRAVTRTILREARLLEARPVSDGDEDVDGAIREVLASARWV